MTAIQETFIVTDQRYHKMGRQEDAIEDREKIVALIKQNHESKKLFW